MNIPKNLEECFIELTNIVDKEELDIVKLTAEDEIVGKSHFGLGLWVRNNWKLWAGSQLAKYFNNMGTIPSKSGRILELVVKEACRGQGIGSMLIRRMEDYFRLKGCDIVRVEVFVPNTHAREFYAREQYSNRVIDMVKKL
jgi:ribosomal protein S18 acetylase RimI-like enzyme